MMLKPGAWALLSAAALFADCPNGARPTTPAEKEYYLETVSALKRALPPAPLGWQLQDANRAVQAPANVCNGSDPSRASYSVWYTRIEGQEQVDIKIRTLMRQLPAARAAGDDAAVERLNSEMRKWVERRAVVLTLAVNESRPHLNRNSSSGDVAVLREQHMTCVMFGAPGPSRNLRVASVTATFQGVPEHVDEIVNSWDTAPLKALVESSRTD